MQFKKRALIGSILTVSLVSLWIQLYLLVFRDEIIHAKALSVVQIASNYSHAIFNVSRLSGTQRRPAAAIQELDMHPQLARTGTQPVHLQQVKLEPSPKNISSNFSLSVKPPQGIEGVRLPESTTDPQLQQNNSSQLLKPKSSNPFHVEGPGILNHLPHLRGKPDLLVPLIRISGNRTGVKLVIGIPTIKRSVKNYLPDTLESLFGNLSPNDAKQCLVIVFIGEPWDYGYINETKSMLTKKYPQEIESGLLEILIPKGEFYPDLDHVKLSLNDPKERVKWRTKQNLDYSYLMLHASVRGEYYIQLEDDIITKPGFFSTIMSTVAKQGSEWMVLRFSTLGFIGKLLHTSDLPLVLEFLLMFHADKPGDWLLEDLLTTKICPRISWKECQRMKSKIAKDIKPPLFQHIGYHSSLKGKIQKLKEKSFKAPTGSSHKSNSKVAKNPPLHRMSTNLHIYQGHTLELVYKGTGFFWALTPKIGDYIDFFYDPPIKISAFKFVSGSPIHASDKFTKDTTVEAVPVTNSKAVSKYLSIGHFESDGIARGYVPDDLGPIRALRISVRSTHKTWVVLSQIAIFTK